MLRFDGFGESLHGRFGFGADAGVGQERQGGGFCGLQFIVNFAIRSCEVKGN